MAIDSFNTSLKLKPGVSKTHYSLGNAYDADNQPSMAIEEYRKSIELDTAFIWGYEALVDAYLKQGSYQKAIALLKEAKQRLPDSRAIKDLINLTSFKQVAFFIKNGVDAFSSGKKSEGYELLNKALAINPDFAVTCYTLGYFYYTERRYDEALHMLNKASVLDGEFLLTHKLLGDIYFAKKEFNKAVDEYKKALLISKDDPVILNNLGLSFMNIEDYAQAARFLEKAVELSPQNINFRYSLASVYRDAGRLQESVSEYKKIIAVQPDFLNVHNDLADIYKKNGQHNEAFQEYKKEIDFCQAKLLKSAEDPIILNSIAYAYCGIGQCEKAKELINKALEAKPDYREAYLTLATIQKSLGEYQSALASLEEAKGLSNLRQIFIEQKAEDIKEEFKAISREMKLPPVHTVYLKAGRILEGIIVSQTPERLTLEMNIGDSTGSVTFAKDDIERITSRK
jgi:tetratricopeptide (TPR) repeat protein